MNEDMNMGIYLRWYTYWFGALSWPRDMTLYLISCLFPPEQAHPCLFLFQLVWLKQFQTSEEKSSAINQNTGINERLSEMIMNGILVALVGWNLLLQSLNTKKKKLKKDWCVQVLCFAYICEQLWSVSLLWILSEPTLRVWSSCDGVNVGHTELDAKFGA